MPLEIVRNDITKMSVDAVVNAANDALKMGGGVCGAIFSAAGADKLQAECDIIGGCKTGGAVLTKGYALPAKYIIHAVGPVWRGGSFGEAELLGSCYVNSLNLALENGCESIAFPLISSGIYGYPKDAALHIAVSSISSFLLQHDMTVYLVVYDRQSFDMGAKLFSAIQDYINDNYVDSEQFFLEERALNTPERNLFKRLTGRRKHDDFVQSAPRRAPYSPGKLNEVLSHMAPTFSQTLLKLIDEKGVTDVEVYKRANVDRKLFSKIRSNADYSPAKRTVIAFAIALELNIRETKDLLARAGYTLSPSSEFDVIIEFFIKEDNHDVFEINNALFAFEQPLLGA